MQNSKSKSLKSASFVQAVGSKQRSSIELSEKETVNVIPSIWKTYIADLQSLFLSALASEFNVG